MRKFFEFGKISEIDFSVERTWSGNRPFLIFDIDWLNDEVIADTHRLLSESHVSAMFFATHESPEIQALCKDENLEVGLHLNINNILDGLTPNGNSDRIISDLKLIIPEVKSVRSHSTTFSSFLCSSFAKQGLTHDVWNADLLEDGECFCAVPGQVTGIGKDSIDVACGEGKLHLLEIEMNGETGSTNAQIKSIRKRLT